MGIAYLNGNRLKTAVVAAAHRVLEAQERLNQINVFPVPDGDTGTNMALTLRSVAEGAINAGRLSLPEMSSRLADSALMGARGNSGAVLAQFFQGMAESFSELKRVGPKEFARSMERAVDAAQGAFVTPREGTILTVMRDWAGYLKGKCGEVRNFPELLKASLHTASRSLQETPKRLKVLAKAGVVDAGAQGFVHMLEGVVDLIDKGKAGVVSLNASLEDNAAADMTAAAESMDYQYCTECLVSGEDLDLNRIRREAGELGDSLVVAGNAERARIHVHTKDHEGLFQRMAQLGTVSHRKYDDMWSQHRERTEAERSSNIALITDSSCDLPSEFLIKHKIRVVPVSVSFGAKTYIDRVTITSQEVYRMMAESPIQPATSQPTPAAFKQVYDLAAEHHGQAIAILVSSAISGTYQAGVTAASQQNRMRTTVIDSRTTAGSLGFLVKVAARAVAEGCGPDEVKRRVEASRPYVKLFVAVKTLDYLIRGGRVSKARGFLARLLNLVPILTFSPEGRAVAAGKARPGAKSLEKLLAIVRKRAAGLTDLEFMVCHASAPEEAEEMARALSDEFKIDIPEILAVSPTVGVHVGPGAVAVTMMGFPEGGRPW